MTCSTPMWFPQMSKSHIKLKWNEILYHEDSVSCVRTLSVTKLEGNGILYVCTHFCVDSLVQLFGSWHVKRLTSRSKLYSLKASRGHLSPYCDSSCYNLMIQVALCDIILYKGGKSYILYLYVFTPL